VDGIGLAVRGTISRYSIERRGDCVLIFGAVPIDDFVGLTQRAPEGSVISSDLARLAGANTAYGHPDKVAQLIDELAEAEEKRLTASMPHLSEAARRWFARGEHGLSSETMFFVLTGEKGPLIESDRDPVHHPHDPSDFRRCRLLMEQVPEFQARLPELSSNSAVWAKLVANWDALCVSMDSENCNWRSRSGIAVFTAMKLKEVIGE